MGSGASKSATELHGHELLQHLRNDIDNNSHAPLDCSDLQGSDVSKADLIRQVGTMRMVIKKIAEYNHSEEALPTISGDVSTPANAELIAEPTSTPSEPFTLVLIRHGESEWNKTNQFTGWYDSLLSEVGHAEGKAAGQLICDNGLEFDQAFTSVLTRAVVTCEHVLQNSGQSWMPVTKAWQLNERHYGGLTGLNKQETVEKHGKEQVLVWRRSFATPPPPIDSTNPYFDYFRGDRRYANLSSDQLPVAESLKMTCDRVMPYWNTAVVPVIRSGQRVLIAAHGNSLRALIMNLDGISEDDISGLNVPTGIPLVYSLDPVTLKPIKHPDAISPLSGRYLGDQEKIRDKINGVKNQTK
uniref:Phosphoglycerate mutase n=1 Tax=Octactis speculum TaxID=3111310 RepID=A0A7S2DUE7_9STRA|mmetsp:Transcript_54220/g.74085  ORF Transcript_54220/g.74085 Transcript_54220/m.74085 type:complete len:356 (+) Transcript_54220:56-1123(+)